MEWVVLRFGERAEELLHAALSDLGGRPFLFPAPKPFVIYAGHDEYPTL